MNFRVVLINNIGFCLDWKVEIARIKELVYTAFLGDLSKIFNQIFFKLFNTWK